MAELQLTCAVAMATHNGGEYVEAQLRSIAEQTRRPDQLVVSDDCSRDETTAIVRRLAPAITSDFTIREKDVRVGAVRNFQRALECVDADIVFLCDQDDLWRPEKVATVMSRFESDHDLGGVFGDATIISAEKRLQSRSLWQLAGFSPSEQRRWVHDPLGVLLRRNVVTGATLALRMDLLRPMLPLPEDGWHDLSLAVLLAASSKLQALPTPLMSYRLHASNAAGLPTGSRLSRVLGRSVHLENLDAQARHWLELRSRLEQLGTDSSKIQRITGKIAHLEARRALPPKRRSRARPAMREALRGGYRAYAHGPWSFVRDVLGP